MRLNNSLSASASGQAPRSRQGRFILLGIAIALTVLAVCAVGIVVGGTRLFQAAQGEARQATMVIDQFMRAGANRDSEAAFGLFAQAAEEHEVTQESISELFTRRSDLFTGYQSLQAKTYRVHSGTEGTTATIAGTVTYEDQSEKSFNAMLVREAEQWKLVRIEFPEGLGR